MTKYVDAMIPGWMIGGIRMARIGVVGKYIGKIYSRTKARLQFTTAESLYEEEGR